MRIGILNSGGDCPGLNAVIHGVVGAATTLGWEVVGFRDGFEGLLPPGDYMMLSPEKTIGIMKLGGTILGTTNKGHFVAKVGEGNVSQVPVEIVEKAKNTLRHLEVGALIVVGGDGSLTTGLQLYQMGIPIIGVPKTIDNDIQATATSFGFDSAVATVVDALDRLHTTAESHKRVIVLEVMGRHAGWIALYGGMAGGADVILLPEIPFHLDHVAKAIRKRDAAGRHSTLVVVAEGARMESGELLTKEKVGAKGEAASAASATTWRGRSKRTPARKRGPAPSAIFSAVVPPRRSIASLACVSAPKPSNSSPRAALAAWSATSSIRSATCPSRKPCISSASSAKTAKSSAPPAPSAFPSATSSLI